MTVERVTLEVQLFSYSLQGQMKFQRCAEIPKLGWQCPGPVNKTWVWAEGEGVPALWRGWVWVLGAHGGPWGPPGAWENAPRLPRLLGDLSRARKASEGEGKSPPAAPGAEIYCRAARLPDNRDRSGDARQQRISGFMGSDKHLLHKEYQAEIAAQTWADDINTKLAPEP